MSIADWQYFIKSALVSISGFTRLWASPGQPAPGQAHGGYAGWAEQPLGGLEGRGAHPQGPPADSENSSAPGRTLPVVTSTGCPGLLLCFSALIHNGLAHSFVPFPPGYVTQVNKASLQGPCRNQIMLWVLQIRGLEKAFYLGIITIHSLFDDLFQDN